MMLIGCGHGFRAIGIIDPEFVPYVDKFIEITGVDSIELDMYFNELDDSIIGVCTVEGIAKDVEIDPVWWKAVGRWDREILIFHELAHCVLGQEHRNLRLTDGCSGSIMNEYHIGAYCYKRHYNYYIQELL